MVRPRLPFLGAPILMMILSVAIFALDTGTPLEIAASVLYVAVVLLGFAWDGRRGALWSAGGAIALTLISFLLTPNRSSEAGIFNSILGVAAIVATTHLALRNDALMRAKQETQSLAEHLARVGALGELSASIAHEVNQPLAAIAARAGAALRWLEAEPRNAGRAMECIRAISDDAKRASIVVGRVRDLARRRTPAVASIDVRAVVRDGMTLVAHEAHRRGVSVEQRLGPEGVSVRGDRVQLQQVLVNMLLNALEAAQSAQKPLVEITVQTTESAVCVAVKDNGPGVPCEEWLEAFFTSKPQGLGMGLTISRTIAEAHGGRLWLERSSPRGVIACLEVPRG